MIFLSDVSAAASSTVTNEPSSALIWGGIVAVAGVVVGGIASGFFSKIGERLLEKLAGYFKGKKSDNQVIPQPVTEHIIERVQIIEKFVEPPAERKITNILTHSPYIPDGDKFISRRSELDTLKKMLKQSKQPMIQGVGGLGKSTLAGKLFHELRNSAEYDNLCWVQCSDNLENSILSAFTEKSFDAGSQLEKRQQVFHFLHNPTKKLLILDNVEKNMEDDLLRELYTLPQVQLLVTTRCEELLDFTSYKLKPLAEEDCIKLFYAYCPVVKSGEEMEMVKKLVELVDGHTLALELLAKSVPRSKTLATYYEELKSKGFDLRGLKKVRTNYDGKTTTIADHLKILYDITKISKEQQRILRTMAFMPSVELLPEISQWMKCKSDDDLEQLVSIGWVESKGRGFYMHPVVKETILLDKSEYPDNTGQELLENLGQENYVIDPNEPYLTAIPKLEMMDAFLTNWRKWNPEENVRVARACNEIGYHLCERAMYDRGLKWCQSAVEINDRIHLNSSFTASCYRNLGYAYSGLGDHDSDLFYTTKALEICNKVLPPDHIDFAKTYHSIGYAYAGLNDHKTSLEYRLKALEIYLINLPANHPDLATAYNGIGYAYGELNKHEKALEFKIKALEIRKKVLSPNHPKFAVSYNNIGYTYSNLGDHDKALHYKLQALEIRKKVLPENHPDLARSLNSIGYTYGKKGDYNNKLKCYSEALILRKAILPADHPDLARSYHNVGVTLNQLERNEEAREHLLNAIAIRKKRPECKQMLAGSYAWLAKVETALGNTTAAEAAQTKRLAIINKMKTNC